MSERTYAAEPSRDIKCPWCGHEWFFSFGERELNAHRAGKGVAERCPECGLTATIYRKVRYEYASARSNR